MIFVNFYHITYFDAENNEFLQYRLSATVNAKISRLGPIAKYIIYS